MNKEFDFGDVGKQTPYTTPDNFFEDMQQKVMQRTCEAKPKNRSIRMVLYSAIAVAAVLVGVLFGLPSSETKHVEQGRINIDPELFVSTSFGTEQTVSEKQDWLANKQDEVEPIDRWIQGLSDEELEELVSFSENDIFLN